MSFSTRHVSVECLTMLCRQWIVVHAMGTQNAQGVERSWAWADDIVDVGLHREIIRERYPEKREFLHTGDAWNRWRWYRFLAPRSSEYDLHWICLVEFEVVHIGPCANVVQLFEPDFHVLLCNNEIRVVSVLHQIIFRLDGSKIGRVDDVRRWFDHSALDDACEDVCDLWHQVVVCSTVRAYLEEVDKPIVDEVWQI